MDKKFISFCIITIGKDLEKLNLCINSIKLTLRKSWGRSYEIIIVGENLSSFKDQKDLILVEETEKREYLGYKRNLAFEKSTGENLVFCDDDIIFTEDWVENFINYISFNADWQIAGNKILLPYGGRYWDRNTYLPSHRMVDYDYESNSDLFYQTGGFVTAKRSLIEQIRWDGDIPFYATDKSHKYNEDIDFSMRLKDAGIEIAFDKNNLVWHFDRGYVSDEVRCFRASVLEEHDCEDFKELIKGCKNYKINL